MVATAAISKSTKVAERVAMFVGCHGRGNPLPWQSSADAGSNWKMFNATVKHRPRRAEKS